MYVETGRYLRQMIRDVQIAGGKIEVREFATPADIAALPEALVFNCTGLGSRELFNDQDLHPARGQLAILEPQPEVRYAFTGGPGYMFPRPDGIILGGTFELDEWDTNAGARDDRSASSPATSASSPASAAPLEAAARRLRHSRGDMNYHTPIPQSGGEQSEVLKDKLTPKAIVAALNEHIVGQDDAKKAVAVALAQPLAAPAARRPSCATKSRPRTS